jgi:hypothetical protein
LQHDFEKIIVILAEDFDALVLIAVVCVPDNIGAGFVHGKDYFAFLLRRAIEEPAKLTHHPTYDDQESWVRGNPELKQFRLSFVRDLRAPMDRCFGTSGASQPPGKISTAIRLQPLSPSRQEMRYLLRRLSNAATGFMPTRRTKTNVDVFHALSSAWDNFH